MDLKSFRVTLYLFPLLLFALWQTGSCHSENRVPEKKQNRVANGQWGGENVRMDVTDSGATLQFSCSNGKIEEPLLISNKSFEVRGSFSREGPGPTREGGPTPEPAIYRGSVENHTMTLTAKLSKTNEDLGSFTLEFGKPGRVRRCH
jgi:hypothetical protein